MDFHIPEFYFKLIGEISPSKQKKNIFSSLCYLYSYYFSGI